MAKIIWFTGLSGAGKTTLCKKLKDQLQVKGKCLLVDGDKFRKKSKQFSFSKKNIIKNNLQIINFCKKNIEKYNYILVAVISPLKKTRKVAFHLFKDKYFEIHVFASLKTLINRDTKGLYKRSKQGLIKNLIGFNSNISYEKSDHKHLRINTKLIPLKKCIRRIKNFTKI